VSGGDGDGVSGAEQSSALPRDGWGDLSPGEMAIVGSLMVAEDALDGVADASDDAALAPADDSALSREWQTDLGNAKRFERRHGDNLRYVGELGWHAWDGKRWKIDKDAHEPLRCAHKVAESVIDEARRAERDGPRDGEDEAAHQKRVKRLYAWALKSSELSRSRAMIAAAAPYLALDVGQLDQQSRRLNVLNGTLIFDFDRPDRVRLMKPRRSDYATKIANVAFVENAEAPRWAQFVREVLPDQDTRLFVQRWLGYSCLTGDISEQCMAAFEGKGANGKSTLIDVVARLIGDYAMTSPIETFLHQDRKSGSGPSPDLARLRGARLVRTSEPEPGARLSESNIKQFTGGEKITARELNKPFFEFVPQGKLTMSVNIRPTIVGKDHGIRRRIKVVPFTQEFKERRIGLVEELIEEGPGILWWLIDGWRMWRDSGLGGSRDIDEATANYFREMDPIGQFVAEACEVGKEYRETSGSLMAAYVRWCAQSSEEPKNATAFGRRLSDMGFGKHKTNGAVMRMGVKVLAEWRGAPPSGRDE